ncbi:methyltransferase type 11, partial [Aetokthonos hydrillicola CCALA 1050]|nr:methyltransferase type 11 [Aetokthonos hydrillicola CCALA 1050]
PGGQVVILDGNQKTLRQLDWLNDVFEEPYIREYAASSLEASMGAAGFAKVLTQDVWWISQVNSAVKPILAEDTRTQRTARHYTSTSKDVKTDDNLQGFPSPAFDIVP